MYPAAKAVNTSNAGRYLMMVEDELDDDVAMVFDVRRQQRVYLSTTTC